jgi:hypothetical protein
MHGLLRVACKDLSIWILTLLLGTGDEMSADRGLFGYCELGMVLAVADTEAAWSA